MFDIWVRLIENSAVMSVAVLVMYGLSRLTRNKTSPRVRYICWIVVAVGLLLPVRPVLFTVNVPESVAWMVPAGEHGDIYAEGHTAVYPEIYTEKYTTVYPGIHTEGHTPLCPETNTDNYTALNINTAYAYIGADATNKTVPATGLTAAPTEGYMRTVNWRALLPVVWGAGALLFLLTCTLRHMRFIKKIRRWAVPCTDAEAIALLNGVCREVNLKRVPRMFACPLTATPIITGLFRSLLILPDGTENPERLRLMLLHEVLHIKRGDLWVRLLTLAAMAVHWFNPLVYLMNRAIQTEAELCCDRQVLRIAGDGARAAYGQTVFNTARRTQRMFSVLATALSGEGKNLKRRLADIIERKHTRRGLAIAFAALMIGGVLLAGMLSYEGEVPVPEGGFVEDIGWLGDGVTLDADPDRYAPGPADTADPITLEASNELIIYVPGHDSGHRRFVAAIQIFGNRFPDVNLIVESVGDRDDWDNKAYIQRVGTELMAGMGPDVILTHFFEDIHKTMDSGVFLNLSPLWHRDAGFGHREQLNPAVMDAGIYKGQRYLIPLSYNINLVMGERGLLESVGFDTDGDWGITPFFNALSASLPAARANPMFRIAMSLHDTFFRNGNPTGIPIVDFEQGIVLPEEAALRAFTEAYKPFWGERVDWVDYSLPYELWRKESPEYWFQQETTLFHYEATPVQIFLYYSRFIHYNGDPVVNALRNPNGETHATVRQSVAIRAGSPNYANAWEFIKILLEEDTQYGRIGDIDSWGLGGGIPVNMATVNRQVNEVLRTALGVGFYFEQPALTQEQKEPIRDLLIGVSSASLPNQTEINFYIEAMEPYIRGEQSLDAAMEELGRRLRIYLSE